MGDHELPTLRLNGSRIHHLVTLVPATVSAKEPATVTSSSWFESHANFVLRHQERYLRRLADLRETLLKENKDFAKFHLPSNTERHTGFWESIMADFEEDSAGRKMHSDRHFFPSYSYSVGMLPDDQNRRGHLERLRRIRIMQKRRTLPPQLAPLRGIGLGAKKETGSKGKKTNNKSQPTAYHVDWMRGNHMITPIEDHEKALTSWTLKHLRTVDALPTNQTSELQFPKDIRELLRKTQRSANSIVEEKNSLKEEVKFQENSPPPLTHRTNETVATHRSDITARTHKTQGTHKSVVTSRSNRSYVSAHTPPPPPTSSPTPLIVTSQSPPHFSPSQSVSSSSRDDNSDVIGSVNTSSPMSEASIDFVDRGTSPVGFRLPPLKNTPREAESPPSESSRKRIVVKIPSGIKIP